MPGRVVGQTTDHEGRRGYVLTIQTREQHIRRERATSNICSNQALCALRATIYMSLLGPTGIKEVALQNIAKTAYARVTLSAITGITSSFTAQVFNEFVVQFDSTIDVPALLRALQKENIVAGYPLVTVYPELANSLLVCVTETKTREDIDRLVDAVKKQL